MGVKMVLSGEGSDEIFGGFSNLSVLSVKITQGMPRIFILSCCSDGTASTRSALVA